MGAANALAAYQAYAGRVPATSMQLLTYMALVSRDHDDQPWFGLGHEALAVHALGRAAPAREADIRAVERAITPLLRVGAIAADRRAAPRRGDGRTVRYRLRLVPGVPVDTPQSIDDPPVDNPPGGHSGNGQHPTDSAGIVPRFSAERPTVFGGTSHGNRGTEEKEEKEERVEENHLDPERNPRLSTARPARANDTQTDTDTRPAADPDTCPGCGVLLDPDRVCRHRPCPHYGARLAPVRRLPAA